MWITLGIMLGIDQNEVTKLRQARVLQVKPLLDCCIDTNHQMEWVLLPIDLIAWNMAAIIWSFVYST